MRTIPAIIAAAVLSISIGGCAIQASRDLDAAKQNVNAASKASEMAQKRQAAIQSAVAYIKENFGGTKEFRNRLSIELGESDPIIGYVDRISNAGLTTREVIERTKSANKEEIKSAEEIILDAESDLADAEEAYRAAVDADKSIISIGGAAANVWAPGVATGIAAVLAGGWGTYWTGKRRGKVKTAKIMREAVRKLREQVPGVNEAIEKGQVGEFLSNALEEDGDIEKVVKAGNRHKPRTVPTINPYAPGSIPGRSLAAQKQSQNGNGSTTAGNTGGGV